jgi:hypothetical protein
MTANIMWQVYPEDGICIRKIFTHIKNLYKEYIFAKYSFRFKNFKSKLIDGITFQNMSVSAIYVTLETKEINSIIFLFVKE